MSHSIPIKCTYMDPTPRPGMCIQPDLWPYPTTLIAADDFDRSYFGSDTIRILTGQDIIPSLDIKVTVTGKTLFKCSCCNQYKARVSVEFLKDGEPSDFTGGWIYTE